MLASVCVEKIVWRLSPVLFRPTTRPYPTMGVAFCPCSEATSFSRVVLAASSALIARTPGRSTRTAASSARAATLEDLVEHTNEPPWIEVVLNQSAPEIADAELA